MSRPGWPRRLSVKCIRSDLNKSKRKEKKKGDLAEVVFLLDSASPFGRLKNPAVFPARSEEKANKLRHRHKRGLFELRARTIHSLGRKEAFPCWKAIYAHQGFMCVIWADPSSVGLVGPSR